MVGHTAVTVTLTSRQRDLTISALGIALTLAGGLWHHKQREALQDVIRLLKES